MRCLALHHIIVYNIVRFLLFYHKPGYCVYTRGMVKDNLYVYLDHLLAFDIYRPVEDLSCLVILPEIHTLLQTSVWATELSDHPDKAYVEYILQGISNEFRISFERRQHISPARGNLLIDKPDSVKEYLQWEVLLDKLWKIPLTIPSSAPSV